MHEFFKSSHAGGCVMISPYKYDAFLFPEWVNMSRVFSYSLWSLKYYLCDPHLGFTEKGTRCCGPSLRCRWIFLKCLSETETQAQVFPVSTGLDPMTGPAIVDMPSLQALPFSPTFSWGTEHVLKYSSTYSFTFVSCRVLWRPIHLTTIKGKLLPAA